MFFFTLDKSQVERDLLQTYEKLWTDLEHRIDITLFGTNFKTKEYRDYLEEQKKMK